MTFKNPNIPDSGYDPIASQDCPFLGNFYLSGMLVPSGYPYDIYSLYSYISSLSSTTIHNPETLG